MYNLEQLRMFVVAVESGSFSACARKLGKVQSAISQGIANLEIDLNVQLFDRSTRKPGLTEDGQRLFGYAQAILRQTEELNSAVAAIARQEEGLIRLAVDSVLRMPSFTGILQRFSDQFPATSLEVFTLPSVDIPARVAVGQADMGLMLANVEFGHEVELGYIGGLPFHTVCAPHHPLAGQEVIRAPDLSPHRQLLLKGESGLAEDPVPKLSADIWYTNDINTLIDMTCQGIGWTFLPDHQVTRLVKAGRLKQLVTSFDHKPWNVPVELIKAKNHTMGPAQSWLYDQFVEYLLTTF
ncbi:MAG: LysR family transcriptional regulator [Amphritea sp.]|nr:LysR family transcriptional regulator [Amphritea sp.]